MNKVILFFAVALSLIMICGCGSGGNIDAAKKSFGEFLEALKNPNDNYAEAKKYITTNALVEMEQYGDIAIQMFANLASIKINVEGAKEENGKVILSCKTADGSPINITMVNENGQWKVEKIDIKMNITQ